MYNYSLPKDVNAMGMLPKYTRTYLVNRLKISGTYRVIGIGGVSSYWMTAVTWVFIGYQPDHCFPTQTPDYCLCMYPAYPRNPRSADSTLKFVNLSALNVAIVNFPSKPGVNCSIFSNPGIVRGICKIQTREGVLSS